MYHFSRQSRGSRSMERRSRSYRDSQSPFPRLSLAQLQIKSDPDNNTTEPLMITVEERDVITHKSVTTPDYKIPDEKKTNCESTHNLTETTCVTELIDGDRQNRPVGDWNEVKPHIESIYLTQNMSLEETRLLMIERFGFDAS